MVAVLNFMTVIILPKGGRVLGDLEHQSTCKKVSYDAICSGFNNTAPDYLYG